MGNENTKPHDPFLADILADGRSVTETFTPRLSWAQRRAAANAAVSPKPVVPVVAPKADFDPYTNDTAFVVVPREVMNRLMDKAGVSKAEIEERIREERLKMTVREDVKYFCAQSTESAPIWPLLSLLARVGRKVEAFQMAQVQFRAEAETNKAKAACVYWADQLQTPVVMLLKSGDFQKPEEIAFDLIKCAKEQNRPGFVKQMTKDFASVHLVPVASLYPVVATNAELGDRKVDVLPPAVDDEDVEDPPTEEKAPVVPVLSKEERIEAKAIELAKAAGKDYKSAVSALRGFYRKEAKRLLGL